MLTLFLSLLSISPVPVPGPAPARIAEAPLAIHAKAVWAGDGRVLEKATVLIEDGRIVAFGTDLELPADAEVLEHDGVLSAGLIALHGQTGAVGETRDGTRPALPDARVALGVDARHMDFEAARAAGITALAITPDPSGVTGGTGVVVKSADGIVLRDPAHLSLVFSSDGLLSNREPTSYAGARAMLEALFEKPRGAVDLARSGRLPCLFEVREREDVRRAIAFAHEHGLKGALHGAALAGEVAGDIRASGLSVIVPALSIGAPKRTLDAVVALAKAGVPFGFGLDAPWNHPAVLRLSAALCVRAGVDRKVAWDALTSTAARIAGIADRTGRIERGFDADLVLWSGDPLDLSSSVRAVFVGGRRVYGADAR